MAKKQGHYCKVCGTYRSNESFSGKGHSAHICKKCAALSPAERSKTVKDILVVVRSILDYTAKRFPGTFPTLNINYPKESTRCVEVGFEIKSLSEILGHANTTITLDRYVHSSMELKRDNMNKLAAVGL